MGVAGGQNEAMAVNGAMILQTVGAEERCEVGVIVRRRCCSAHKGNEVNSCVGSVPSVCAFWHCGSCVVFVGLLW